MVTVNVQNLRLTSKQSAFVKEIRLEVKYDLQCPNKIEKPLHPAYPLFLQGIKCENKLQEPILAKHDADI